MGFLGVGQVGHPFVKSIEKMKSHKSFHFIPANLASLATSASMGQRKTQQEQLNATT